MSHLAAGLLMLAIVWNGRVVVFCAQLRNHPLGAEERAEQLSEYVHEAAAATGIDPYLLGALLWGESRLDAAAVQPDTGAFGLPQLHPRSRWARRLRADCAESPADCERRSVYWAAVVLHLGRDVCGDELGAVRWYRSGKCAQLDERAERKVSEVLATRAFLSQPVYGPRRGSFRLLVSGGPKITLRSVIYLGQE